MKLILKKRQKTPEKVPEEVLAEARAAGKEIPEEIYEDPWWTLELEHEGKKTYLFSLLDARLYSLSVKGLIEPQTITEMEGEAMVKLLNHIQKTVPLDHLMQPLTSIRDYYTDMQWTEANLLRYLESTIDRNV